MMLCWLFKFKMGNECRKTSQMHLVQEYSFIQPQSHPAFGNIFYLRCDRSKVEKAVKQIPCPNEAIVGALRKRMDFARECDNNMTLVQIYDYDIIDQHSQDVALWKALSSQYQTNCRNRPDQPSVLVHFQYFPPSSCLSEILKSRRGQLEKLVIKYGKGVLADIRTVKMWNYSQIDRLSSHLRQVVNVFYQEIQVIRMIDHVIGAVYFLHHFDVPHAALRPQQVMVDEDGRFVLVDREVFSRQSNYELALQLLQAKERRGVCDQGILNYLCPQYLLSLKNKIAEPDCSQEKADIFCVGLLALSMCLLDNNQKIFEYSSYQRAVKMNESEVTKRLVRMKERYSQSFSDLVCKMVKKDPDERIDFAELIDELNPLLQTNLESIKRVHSIQAREDPLPEHTKLQQTYEYGNGIEQQQLKSRLLSMQKQFQKVMNNRTLLFNRNANDLNLRQQQSRILDKLQKIKTARSEMSTKLQPPRRAPEVTVSKFNDKRYISGKQLQEIVWKEYQNIKSRRQVQK